MMTNISMLFYIKKQKNYTNGPAPIYLRITVDGKRSEIATGRGCLPEKWSNISERATGTKEDIKKLNFYLDNLQAKVYEAHRLLSDVGEPVSSEILKNKLLGKGEKVYLLIEIF